MPTQTGGVNPNFELLMRSLLNAQRTRAGLQANKNSLRQRDREFTTNLIKNTIANAGGAVSQGLVTGEKMRVAEEQFQDQMEMREKQLRAQMENNRLSRELQKYLGELSQTGATERLGMQIGSAEGIADKKLKSSELLFRLGHDEGVRQFDTRETRYKDEHEKELALRMDEADRRRKQYEDSLRFLQLDRDLEMRVREATVDSQIMQHDSMVSSPESPFTFLRSPEQEQKIGTLRTRIQGDYTPLRPQEAAVQRLADKQKLVALLNAPDMGRKRNVSTAQMASHGTTPNGIPYTAWEGPDGKRNFEFHDKETDYWTRAVDAVESLKPTEFEQSMMASEDPEEAQKAMDSYERRKSLAAVRYYERLTGGPQGALNAMNADPDAIEGPQSADPEIELQRILLKADTYGTSSLTPREKQMVTNAKAAEELAKMLNPGAP